MTASWPRLSAGLCLLLILAGLLGLLLRPQIRPRFPSSLSADPEGLLAFRRLLESLGTEPHPWTWAWDQLEPAAADGVLIVATPLQRRVNRAEAAALQAWIEAGGCLFVVDDASWLERDPALEALLEQAGLERSGRPDLPGMEAGFLKKPALQKGRGTGIPPLPGGLDDIPVHAEARLLPGLDALPLALGEEGDDIVGGAVSLGEGRIVRVLGPLLANEKLLQGDTLDFALAVVEDLRAGGMVWFDEYHHGYGGFLPLARGLDRTVLAACLGQVVLVVVLYGLARGIRFGPPHAVRRSPQRSSLEFVRSMAALYRRGRACQHALWLTRERLFREIRGRWGDASSTSRRLTEMLARRSRMGAAQVKALMEAVESALNGPEITEATLRKLAAPLVRLQKEVMDGSGPRP